MEKWDELLRNTGFTGTDLVLHNHEQEQCRELSVLVTTAIADVAKPLLISVSIIIQPGREEQEALARILQARFHRSGQNSSIPALQDLNTPVAPLHQETYMYLLEYEAPFIDNLDQSKFSTFQRAILATKNALWVTGGGGKVPTLPGFGAVDGFARALRNEDTSRRFATLALEHGHDLGDNLERHARHIAKVWNQAFIGADTASSFVDLDFKEQHGVLGVERLIKSTEAERAILSQDFEASLRAIKECPPLRLQVLRPGVMDTLQFTGDDVTITPIGVDEVEVEVKAIGLAMADSLTVADRQKHGQLGNECSGVVLRAGTSTYLQAGDRVCVLGIDTCRTVVRSRHATKVSSRLSFAEAAAVPASYVTAMYSLRHVARIERGETVLIHNAVCGLGLACIEVARFLGVEIFVTVSGDSERQKLIELFALPADRILSYHDHKFARAVRRLTNERGVDVVLNNLGELGTALSWDCLAPMGRFIEVGLDNKSDERRLKLAPASHVMYSTTDLRMLIRERPALVTSLLIEAVAAIEDGKMVKPSMLIECPVSRIEDAFMDIMKRENLWKTVVTVDGDEKVKAIFISSSFLRIFLTFVFG